MLKPLTLEMPAVNTQKEKNSVYSPRVNTGAADRLRDPEEVARLCELIAQRRGVCGACAVFGVHPYQVWREARRNPEFETALFAARQDAADALFDECVDIADAATDPAAAQVAKLQIDTRLRVAGKLRQERYGDGPGTQVSIHNQTAIVCDEETRAKLIGLREQLLSRSKSHNAEQLPESAHK